MGVTTWRRLLGAAAVAAVGVAAACPLPAGAVSLIAPPTPLPTPFVIFTSDTAQYVRLPLVGEGADEAPRVAVNGPRIVDDGSGSFVSPLGCGAGGVGTLGCSYRAITIATLGANGSIITDATVITHQQGGFVFQSRADFSFGRSMAVINGQLVVTTGTDQADDPEPGLITMRLGPNNTVTSTSRMDLRPVLCGGVAGDDSDGAGPVSCAPARMTDFYMRAVGDVDGDGVEDALVYMFRSIHVVFLTADSAGIKGWKSTFLPELFSLFYGRFDADNVAVLPDINRDGVAEVAVQGVARQSDDDGSNGPPEVIPTRVWVLYLDTSGAVASRSPSPFGFMGAGGFTGTPAAPFDPEDFDVEASDVATFGSLLVAMPRLNDGRTLLLVGSDPRTTVWVVSVGGDGRVQSTDTIPVSEALFPGAERVVGLSPLGEASAEDSAQRVLVTTDEGLDSQRWLMGLNVRAAADAARVPPVVAATPTPEPTPELTPELEPRPVVVVVPPVATPGDLTPEESVEAVPEDSPEGAPEDSPEVAPEGTAAAEGDDDDGGDEDERRQPGDPLEETPGPLDDDDSVCFPGDATVELASGRHIPMSRLALGDTVRVSATAFSRVYLWTHKLAGGAHTFVRLSTSSGATLRLTPGHYVYANGRLTAAAAVAVGDTVELVGPPRCEVVTATSRVVGLGLYNPQTLHGDIVVDGFVTSTYTTAVEPTVAAALLSPLRALYRATGASVGGLEGGADRLAALLPRGRTVY